MKYLSLFILAIIFSCNNSTSEIPEETLIKLESHLNENKYPEDYFSKKLDVELQKKAEEVIKKYCIGIDGYSNLVFGEMYVQLSVNDIEKICESEEPIQYSILLNSIYNGNKRSEYFQLSKDVEILCVLDEKELTNINSKKIKDAVKHSF